MFVFTDPMASGASAARPAPSTAAEGLHLDRVAERGAGAVGLDVADLARRDAAVGQRVADDGLLGRPVRRGEPAAGAVLVHRRAPDHGEDAVAVGQRVVSRFSTTTRAALAAHEAVGGGVERLAPAVRRHHVVLRQRDA